MKISRSCNDFSQEIVGESNYKKTLSKCFKSKKSYGNSVYMPVTLQYEDTNKYDSKAVVCMSKFGVIGYLNKEDARLFRKLTTREQTPFKVQANIYKNPEYDNYGVYLKMVIPDVDISKELEDIEREQDIKNGFDFLIKLAAAIIFIIIFAYFLF